jgi:hypothetical protein
MPIKSRHSEYWKGTHAFPDIVVDLETYKKSMSRLQLRSPYAITSLTTIRRTLRSKRGHFLKGLCLAIAPNSTTSFSDIFIGVCVRASTPVASSNVLCILIDEAVVMVNLFEVGCQVEYRCQVLECKRVRVIFTSTLIV